MGVGWRLVGAHQTRLNRLGDEPMRTARGLLVGFVLLLSPAAVAVGQVVPEFLITPGVGIGQIHIGAPLVDAKTVLGPEANARKEDSLVHYTWRTMGKGLFFVWASSDKVVGVGVQQDDRYTTDKGLTTGDRPDKVRQVMGDPLGVDHQVDPRGRRFDVMKYQGIQFTIPRDQWDGVVDVVLQIAVTEGK